ncbi:hypothetical protein QT982_25685, partial [Microcoleus sp. herbarium2]
TNSTIFTTAKSCGSFGSIKYNEVYLGCVQEQLTGVFVFRSPGDSTIEASGAIGIRPIPNERGLRCGKRIHIASLNRKLRREFLLIPP